jgi:hypothetical protein
MSFSNVGNNFRLLVQPGDSPINDRASRGRSLTIIKTPHGKMILTNGILSLFILSGPRNLESLLVHKFIRKVPGNSFHESTTTKLTSSLVKESGTFEYHFTSVLVSPSPGWEELARRQRTSTPRLGYFPFYSDGTRKTRHLLQSNGHKRHLYHVG